MTHMIFRGGSVTSICSKVCW